MSSREFEEFMRSSQAVSKVIEAQAGDIPRIKSPLDRLEADLDIMKLVSDLNESRQQFYKTFHNSVIPKCVVSALGYFIEVNQASVDLWGYSREDLLGGMRWQDITAPEDISTNQALVTESLVNSGVIAQSLFKHYVTKQGDHELCWNRYFTILDQEKKPTYFITSIISESFMNKFNNLFAKEKARRAGNGGISH